MRCAVCVQDNVPAFESAQAVAIVERNLGGPIGTFFESFDMTPIAAASLGQVRLGNPTMPALADAFFVRIRMCTPGAEQYLRLSESMGGPHS
jgi:ABC1 atypical kinase-like domain